ncbi:MAG TPA: UDP-N-acetylmuramoyl-tripeptide--D-alanyl-D-alanine ligase [Thermoanaerobaculia bacterium]|nr:UDP-N-acetylmuramoyl-tripeptide--D-alanyl-D-alanine ligase [Thermoanaerobaculia bacterium]
MPPLTFVRIASMVGGRLVQGGEISAANVVIDSREADERSVFFAIRGERLDGHDFLAQALEKARGTVVSRLPDPLPAGRGLVQVDDTSVALQRLAESVRREFPFLLVAVTGSAGKTTTKEMIHELVTSERRAFKSWGNFNNQIGFPLCLSNVPADAEIVVSEMGMNHAGEIAQMAGYGRPDVGVYTNIRPVHLEFFGTIERIAAAKRELLENLASGGRLVLNADDPQVMRIAEGFEGRRVTYGFGRGADFCALAVEAEGLRGTSFRLLAEGAERPMRLGLPGAHNLENLLAAIATARLVGISWEGIERGISRIRPAYHRGQLVEWNGASLYDDTYNSNPYALGRALELLEKADAPGRRIAVVGDMLELGPEELRFHRESGKAMPRSVDLVVAVGPRSKSLLEGAREAGFSNGALHHFDDASEAASFLRSEIRAGDLVLLKGSRGIGLDRIVTELEGGR